MTSEEPVGDKPTPNVSSRDERPSRVDRLRLVDGRPRRTILKNIGWVDLTLLSRQVMSAESSR